MPNVATVETNSKILTAIHNCKRDVVIKISTIARETGLDPRTVERKLREVELYQTMPKIEILKSQESTIYFTIAKDKKGRGV